MRFIIGFLIGVAAGFYVSAVRAGEANPLALLTGAPSPDS